MKKILFILSLVTAFNLGILGFNLNHQNTSDVGQCLMAQRGCCSHHGGVCGCYRGRTQCCDGSLSPSCQCFRDEQKGLQL